MKASSLVAVALFAASLTACQRQAASERAAASSAPSSPAPAAASPAPPETRAVQPAEAAPAPTRQASTSPVAPAPAETPAAPPPSAMTAAPGAGGADATPPQPAQPAIVVPAGTRLTVRLAETLASDKSEAEQQVLAELAEDVPTAGRVVLPAGSEVVGHVVIAQRSGRVKGRARLVVAFDEVRARGRSYAISATRWDVTAESSRSKDAKIAGGAAAAGVIIGAIAGGGSGALKGGLIGGAAGGAAVLVTRGKEVELRSGVPHTITLRKALRVE